MSTDVRAIFDIVRAASRENSCERCGAQVGDPCRTKSGRATSSHQIREARIRSLVYEAYWAGIYRGKRFARKKGGS